METDREMLLWYYTRLYYQMKDSHLVDFMHRFRWIILAQSRTKSSRGQKAQTCNSHEAFKILFKNPTELELKLLNELINLPQ